MVLGERAVDGGSIALWIAAALIGLAAVRVAAIEYLAPLGDLAPAGFIRETGQAAGVASIQAGATARSRVEAEAALEKARAAVKANPLSSQAFIGAAFAQSALGRQADAERTMGIALNRDPRNLGARRWMIAQTLKAGRYDDALGHIDAALQQKPTLAGEMTRLIVPLLAARGMVDAFATRLSQNPAWGPAFLDSARRSPFVAPQLTDLMVRLSRDAQADVPPASVAMVVTSALSRGDVRSARRIYSAFYPQGDAGARSLNNGGLSATDLPAPFNWMLTPDGTADVQFVRNGDVAGLEVRALGGEPRQLAEQALTLPPGRYLLGSDVAEVSLADGTQARWVVRCARGGADLASLALPSAGRKRRVSVVMAVPPTCPIQSLALMLQQDSRSNGAMVIDAVSLEPAGALLDAQP